jgi:hypothetical protein
MTPLHLHACREISIKVSTQPVLFAIDVACAEPIPAQLEVANLSDVPRSILVASQRLHDFQVVLDASHVKLSWRRNPVAGMKYASMAADGEPSHLLHIPAFVKAPSRRQRYWLRSTLNAVVVCIALRFLFVNSPLNGSKNLQNWGYRGYMGTVRGFRCGCSTALYTHVFAASAAPRSASSCCHLPRVGMAP